MKKTKLSDYNPKVIESKWQKIWAKNKTFQADLKKAKKPYYNLMMFPYPSAEGLHVGNMYAFTGSDIWGRYIQMNGFDVFEPIGLDGFGIHSENYALKTNTHPKKQAQVSEKNFYRQLKAIGNMFSWDNKLETYDPDYYQWTQWLFIKLFKAGLAYRAKAPVNWCPSCKTVLADEQVINSRCERCEAVVEPKQLEQWFFKITKYADRLLSNTYKIDWSPKVLAIQRNWIGRSQGINISYPIYSNPGVDKETPGLKNTITCFTTRPDTNFGAAFICLAPEHSLITEFINSKSNLPDGGPNSKKEEIKQYVEKSKKQTKEERISQAREKTGVFTGLYALNQLTNYKMPIWVADFVLMDVGTGAVVAVPGHDLRDFEFAKKYGLKIIRVVVGIDKDKSEITRPEQVQEDKGYMINSQFLNGLDIHKATKTIMDYLEKKGWGKRTTTYHLRDWLISRQRYWGPPIPMIYCHKCASNLPTPGLVKMNPGVGKMAGWQPVPEEDLPIILPEVKDWRPKGTGRGPLAQLKEWQKVKCPKCGGGAQRETDVSDTFLDSAWYFLRYPSIRTGLLQAKRPVLDKPWDQTLTKKWLPVDMYIGGAEHSVLHLLYSRFLTMVLKDLGYLSFSAKGGLADEPYIKFRAHGLIIKDGAKMSKSKGNIVNPDKYIEKYGADALRCYLMFVGPYTAGGDFRDTAMVGMYKFLSRVYRLVTSANKLPRAKSPRYSRPSGSTSLFSRLSLIRGLKAPRYSDRLQNKTSAKNTSDGGARPKAETTPPRWRNKEELYWQHKTIKRVEDGIKRLKYNTSIASLMEYVNYLAQSSRQKGRQAKLKTQSCSLESLKTLILLLAPFAPHLTEELWQTCKSRGLTSKTAGKNKHVNPRDLHPFNSIHHQPWPKYNSKLAKEEKIELIIQVNGKLRDKLQVDPVIAKFISRSAKQKVVSLVKKREKIQNHLKGKTIKKTIFIKSRLINFVV